MLDKLIKFLSRRQKPAYQSGTNLLLILVLSVVIGAGIAYATIGFMKSFERVVNWVYFDWSETPSGRYTHKFDARNKLQFDFRGDNKHGLEGLLLTQWATKGKCSIVTTRNGVRLKPVVSKWEYTDDLVSIRLEDQNSSTIILEFTKNDLLPAGESIPYIAEYLPNPDYKGALLFKYKQGSFTDIPKWHILTALTGGGLFIGFLYLALKLPRAFGPADAIIARINNDGVMPIREGISTALICATSIGLGASVGRYGPAIHLGATLGSGFGQAFKLGRTNTMTFLGCGVASAIACSFNTPIAAVIFTHEAIIGHYSLRAFAPITIAAVVGNAVAIHHGRIFDGFQNLTPAADLSLGQYPLFVIVGLISGLLAIAYMRSILFVGKVVKEKNIPLWSRPMLAGLTIGLVAIWLPNLLGLVEETTTQVIQDQGVEYVFHILCLLIVFKIASTALCLSCGMHGGVFGPALCIGAMVGAGLALVYNPDYYQIFTLAGMGACISSVVGAPIATILIVFEINQNYSVATAVMVAVAISNLVTNKYFARSFFLFQVQAAGFDINAGREVLILKRRRIREVMEQQYFTIEPTAELNTVEESLLANPEADLYVTDSEQKLIGVITLASAWDALKAGKQQTASELAVMPEHILTEETDLNRGFEIIEEFVGVSIPVVENTDSMRMTGIIHEANIIQAYNEAVKKARGEELGLE
jgi:CIC family chloride channel protein